MHKGYTLNYFINFFQDIPDHRWCEGTFQNGNTVQHCAAGHALRNSRTTLNNTTSEVVDRLGALEHFLNDSVANINDNLGGTYTKLGKTPRGRVLTALRNRRRTGNIWGKKSS